MNACRFPLIRIAVIVGLVAMFCIGVVHAQEYPPALGFLDGGNNSGARDISPNGRIVVGTANPPGGQGNAFIWTAETGLRSLHPASGAPLNSLARFVSDDGHVAAGIAVYTGLSEAFRWTEQTGMQPLGVPSGFETTSVSGMSADGMVVVGTAVRDNQPVEFLQEAYRWSTSGGIQLLGYLGGYNRSSATGISEDGMVVVGTCRDSNQVPMPTQAFRWTSGQGMEGLGYLPGHNWSRADDVSRDGGVVTGQSRMVDGDGNVVEQKGYWWSADSGMMDLGTMPGATHIEPLLMSGDGSIVIGRTNGTDYFIWDDSLGMRGLPHALANEYNIQITGWSNFLVYAVEGTNRRLKYLAGQGRNSNGQTEAWRLPPIRILHPVEGDRWRVEQEKTIEWQTATSEFFMVEVSVDSGRTYAEVGQVIDGTRDTLWRIPDSLRSSSKMRIRVSDLFDTTCAEVSAPFTVRAYDLVAVEPDSSLKPFHVDKHGWRFSNSRGNMWPPEWWANFDYLTGIDPFTDRVYDFEFHFKYKARSSFFPDWPLWVTAYGTDINYWSTALSIYSGRAQRYWRNKHSRWGGSCYGFAVSSLLAFRYPDYVSNRFPDLAQVDSLYALALDDTTRAVVNEYFIHQYSKGYYAYSNSVRETITPRALLNQVRTVFLNEQLEPATLTLHNPDSSGAHGVLPYLLKRDAPGNGKFRLYVYDSNNPGSLNQYIEIDSLNNTWRTRLTGLSWGPGQVGCFLDLPVNAYMQLPYFQPERGPTVPGVQDDLEIALTPGSESRLTNAAGQEIGHVGGAIVNTIPGAISITPITGSNSPPLGFVVPPDRYVISFSGVSDSLAYVSIVGDSNLYGYERDDAHPADSERLVFDNGLGVLNPGSVPRRVRLSALGSGIADEQAADIDRISIAPGDSLHVELVERVATTGMGGRASGRHDLRLVNAGAATTYDLRLRYAAPDTSGRFTHGSIPLVANASHVIVPSWEAVETVPVMILIDLGSDGSIDDTLRVDNEPLGLRQNATPLHPDRFRLYPNYPNPFNPTTTIAFDLPEAETVLLEVFNLLGERVATLVSGALAAGSYRYEWDGGNLASGIYIYRLQAGDFVQSRKMVLLR